MSCEVIAQVDIAGPWGTRRHEDDVERGGGPEVGDYTGLPITDAARFQEPGRVQFSYN